MDSRLGAIYAIYANYANYALGTRPFKPLYEHVSKACIYQLALAFPSNLNIHNHINERLNFSANCTCQTAISNSLVGYFC
jgi:hypothetical protein